MKNALMAVVLLLVLAAPLHAAAPGAELKLNPVFSDHMVLQRGIGAPVWGTAAPGETVTVTFAGQTKTATADDAGKWLVKLEPLTASAEPRDLVVESKTKNKTAKVSDVLVGEVWVGSGQSNMAGGVGGYAKNDPGLAAIVAGAPYPLMRHVRARGPWQVADAANVNGFSAILFAFGLRLHKELNVPVGLMLGAVGGTPSGYWLSEEALKDDPACQALIKQYAATFDMEAAQKKYAADLAKWEKDAAAAKQAQARSPRRPTPPAKPGEATGNKTGCLYEAHIRPFLPFAIRGVLWDQGESGTALAGVDQYTLMGALINGWRREWGQGPFPFIYVQKPSGGGCAWDPANPVTSCGEKFEPLPAKVPADGQYVETHVKIMDYPHTGMAVSSDLGPGVHPTNKSGYGHRAADVALGMAYGQKHAYYGPVYAAHTVEGSTVRVRFTHVGQGLAFKHGDKLQGFAVAGTDKNFHWADATIDGDSVVLSCAAVREPVSVRYAWASNRRWANLFNKDGLPALPFRTDQ